MPRLRKKGKINRANNLDIIKTSITKIAAVLIIVSLNWAGLSSVIGTFAYFNDTENSIGNIFSAGTLDFSIPPFPDFSPEVMPTQNSTRTINLENDGSLDFQYEIKVENATGILCDHLNLKDDLIDVFQPLIPFVSATTTFSDKSAWLFTVKLTDDDEGLQNQTCTFDLVFNGWQIDSDGTWGFGNKEVLSNIVTSGAWTSPPPAPGSVVINELMWMGSYKKPKDEWIELRNMTDSPIDIGGWQLTKLSGWGKNKYEELILEIPAGKTIPADGFFLISNFDKDKSAINVEPDLVDEKVDLRDWGLQIKLYKGDWQEPSNLIDVAGDGKGWPLAGYHGIFFHFSMERNDIPGDGTLKENWHTCFDDSPEMRAYWEPLTILGKSLNRGTPGGRNLSDYDEAALIEYYQQLEEEILAQGLLAPDWITEEETEITGGDDGSSTDNSDVLAQNEEDGKTVMNIDIDADAEADADGSSSEGEAVGDDVEKTEGSDNETENQPADIPESDSADQDPPTESAGDSGGDSGATETGGEITGDSGEAGDSGETISE